VRTISFVNESDLAAAVSEVAEVLAQQGVVLVPTETYYGLAADPFSSAAVAAVFRLKERPDGLPLPILAGSWRQVEELVTVPADRRPLLERFWPGPVTAVLELRRPCPACAGPTAAVRIPGHDLLRSLLARTGPVSGTSANRHGAEPAVSWTAALQSLAGGPDLVLAGGETSGGSPSTIVDLTDGPPKVLRGDPRSVGLNSVNHRS
jgi:L-threonylcarbamoyladenylate synthase